MLGQLEYGEEGVRKRDPGGRKMHGVRGIRKRTEEHGRIQEQRREGTRSNVARERNLKRTARFDCLFVVPFLQGGRWDGVVTCPFSPF